MIKIAVINESTAIADAEVQKMIGAFEKQWNRDLAPCWGLEEASFTWTAKNNPPPAGAWWVVFLDDSDQASALAYHDLTDIGLPISKVFVKTILADKASVSVGATHEICEMAVDPTLNLAAQDDKGTFWAYEVCDPVEDDKYAYDVDGVLVTDFVTPRWFAYQHAHGPIDFQHHAKKPFVILDGGYAQKFGKNGWEQITGHEAVKARAKQAPVGSRRERRARGSEKWTNSERAHARVGLREKMKR
jgi:hypothetical protein